MHTHFGLIRISVLIMSLSGIYLFFAGMPVYASQNEVATILVRIKPEVQIANGSLQTAIERWTHDIVMLRPIRTLDSHTPIQGHQSALRSVYELTVEQSALARALTLLRADPAVAYAEENTAVKALFTPNDPDYGMQWHLPKIGVDSAWDRADTLPFSGSSSVVVAVIDTGIAYENSTNRGKTFAQAPDFASTTFVSGYDFVNGSVHANDDNGHGTHVASTIAEGTNNGIAGAGIAFSTSIMPIKVLDATGSGTVADVVQGLTYATQNGAKVINLSLGANYASQTLRDAITTAINAGIIVVAAAGNEGGSSLALPAGYPGVLSVSALGKTDTIASYSNTGTGLALSAPGGDGTDYVMQQTFSNLDSENLPLDYTTFGMVGYQGTSQAAPQVAAAAALLLAKNVPASSIVSLLENSSTDLGPSGYDTTYGYGRLNIGAALIAYLNDTTPPVSTLSISPDTPNGANGYYVTAPSVTLTATDGAASSGVRSLTYQIDGGVTTTYTAPVTIADGSHTLTYYATDNAGNAETPRSLQLAVDTTGPVITVTAPSAGVTTLDTVTLTGTVIDAVSGTASLTVGGVATIVDTNGAFTASTTLHVGSNLLQLSATDSAGAISSSTLHLVLVKPSQILTSTLSHGSARVIIYTQQGKRDGSFAAFTQNYQNGVVLAAGDVDADGYDEIIAARQSGTPPQVRVYSRQRKLLKQFYAYETRFRGGVSIAAADIDGNGQKVIVTAPGPGRSPDIRLYTVQGKKIGHFLAYSKTYRNGIRIAAGDIDGDGKAEIIVGPMQGKNTKVKIFRSDGTLVHQFYVYDKSFSGGIWLAAGDLDGNGVDEIITGPGAGKPPIVKVLDATGKVLRAMTVYDKKFLGGVTVAAGDLDGNGVDNILVGNGPGKNPIVKILDGVGKVIKQFKVYTTSYLGGIDVTAGHLQ